VPSEAAAVAKTDDASDAESRDKNTALLQTDETGTSPEGSRIESIKPSLEAVESHSLEAVSESDAQNDAQEDSAALARISEQIAGDVVSDVVVRDATGAQDFGIPRAVAITRPADGTLQQLVADGGEARLLNGDVLFGITVPDKWVEAIRAEAEIQNQTAAAYLQQWFADALENYWVSNYSQSR
jgi:hypothetical protein